MKKALLALALVVSATGASYADSVASNTVIGFYLTPGSTSGTYTCPSSSITPCFISYGVSVPTTPAADGNQKVNIDQTTPGTTNGVVTKSGSVTATTPASRTLITLDSEEALAFAENVPAKLYGFKDKKGMFSDDRKHIGFYAQDVQKFAPHIAQYMVSKMAPTSSTPDGTLSLDYSDTGPIALAAIRYIANEISLLWIAILLLVAWNIALTRMVLCKNSRRVI